MAKIYHVIRIKFLPLLFLPSTHGLQFFHYFLCRLVTCANLNWLVALVIRLELHYLDLLWICCTTFCTANPQQNRNNDD